MQEKPRLRLVPSATPAKLEDGAPQPDLDVGNAPGEVETVPQAGDCAATGPVKIDLGPGDVAALKRILQTLAKDLPDNGISSDGKAEKEIAQLLFNLRRARAHLFPPSMFGEAAWDMLIALYISDQSPAAADLARWTSTPLTTAMRWIAYLEDHDLIERQSSVEDRRAHKIRLTGHAHANMQKLFSDLLDQYP